jgi:hypothetical protein
MDIRNDCPIGGMPRTHWQSFRKRAVVAGAPLLLAMSAALPALSSTYNIVPGSPDPPVVSCNGNTPGFCPGGPFTKMNG